MVIARFLGDAGVAGGPEADADAEVPDAEAGSVPAIPSRRGRVKVMGGELMTDIGTPLRGFLLPVDTGWKLTNFDMIADIAQTSGLNLLHVYLEDTTQVTGMAMAQADALVSLAAQAGLYVAIGIGTDVGVNSTVGKINQPKINDFWNLYAPRYASQSHVLFEVINNPEATCDQPITEATLNAERDTYQLIRSLAPDTHIMMFSTTSLIQPKVLTDAVARLGTVVDWSNASFTMGFTSTCLSLVDVPKLTDTAKALGVAIFASQLDRNDWAAEIEAFEPAHVSWSHFRWFVNNKDLASFRTAMTTAGVTWCPDRGVFPQDASVCRPH